MPYEDKVSACVECGAEYTFTAAEAEVFAGKGFVNPPKRCKACRDARKSQKASSGNRDGAANTFSSTPVSSHGGRDRGGYAGGGGGGRGRGGFGGGGPRQMFPATCAQCGKQTEVPFKPTGSRPVYCRECFQQQRPPQ